MEVLKVMNKLKFVDIVITNPPFSLFREFIAKLKKNMIKNF